MAADQEADQIRGPDPRSPQRGPAAMAVPGAARSSARMTRRLAAVSRIFPAAPMIVFERFRVRPGQSSARDPTRSRTAMSPGDDSRDGHRPLPQTGESPPRALLRLAIEPRLPTRRASRPAL